MRTRRWCPAVALAAAAALTLSACSATDDPNGGAGSAGVPYGATQDQYRAAFEGVDPITLKIQVDGPQGHLANHGRQVWADAVRDWSGGKIDFEWGYSAAFAPASTEWAAALGDGRIDVTFFLPYYTPEVFPSLTALTDAAFLDGNRPTSTLVSSGWMTDIVYRLPQLQEEAEAEGIHILALGPVVNLAGIFCKQDRNSPRAFAGVATSASGQGRVRQLKSLGLAPQSIAFTELYEAIQRNLVECASTVPTALDTVGAADLLPYAVADPQAGLVGFPSFLAVRDELWDSLPLVARQLLFDRLDVYMQAEPRGQGERMAQWFDRIRAKGGGVKPLSEDGRARLLQTNQEMLGDLAARGADTGAFVTAFDKWNNLVNIQLYPEVTPVLEDFLHQGGYDTLDTRPFTDALFREVLLPNRPS